MPTFTYSFTKNESFNVLRSASTVGALTEHFRKEPGVARTKHPLFSAAVWGKKKSVFSEVSADSFGKDSIFDLLFREDATLLFFGVSMQAMTFLHYIEQSHGVPYRYIKTFSGTVVAGKKKRQTACTFYVRDLSQDIVTDLTAFAELLRKKGLLREARVGGGSILTVRSRDCFREGINMLDRDIRAFLKKKTS